MGLTTPRVFCAQISVLKNANSDITSEVSQCSKTCAHCVQPESLAGLAQLRLCFMFFFDTVVDDLHVFVLPGCCWWKCSSAFSWSGSKTSCPHSSMTDGAVLSHSAVCKECAKHIMSMHCKGNKKTCLYNIIDSLLALYSVSCLVTATCWPKPIA